MRNGVQTVDRALQLLQAFEMPEQELGVTELAGALGVHKSTASRLAATLAARGFLERAPRSESFRLGPELARLALLAARGGDDLEELARPAMARLAGDTGETVNLALLDAFEAVNIAQADGRHIVGVGSWTGRRTALHCTANGKVLLAFSGRTLPGGELEAFTARTITSRRVLERELGQVRARGYATAVGELEEGLHAVAVPLRDRTGSCVAALSVSGPTYRMAPATLGRIAERCCEAAAEVESRLGRSARAA
jgi:DNA-binding IclR family transcriptional regulator